jgi:mediator of RNA polymerase II transcription subunit 14
VNRLNKLKSFHNLKMLSFDLRAATFTYHPGYMITMTYNPSDDSYEVTFGRNIPAKPSPHDKIAGLLSHRLNELVGNPRKKGLVGGEFISVSIHSHLQEPHVTSSNGVQLLRDTLPLLMEIEDISATLRDGGFPLLVIRSVSLYKLVWDVSNKRYIIDFLLLPTRQDNGGYLIRDAAGTSDGSCGPVTRVPGFEGIVQRVWEDLKRTAQAEGFTEALAFKMDGGKSLVVSARVVGSVVRAVKMEVEKDLGL